MTPLTCRPQLLPTEQPRNMATARLMLALLGMYNLQEMPFADMQWPEAGEMSVSEGEGFEDDDNDDEHPGDEDEWVDAEDAEEEEP